MIGNRFHWALKKLDEIGLIVCARNGSYLVKQRNDEGYLDLNSNPEIKSLLNLEKSNADQIILLALKLKCYAATH